MLTVDLSGLKKLEGAIERGECLLIDVRERGEYEAGHIPHAVNLPLSQLDQWRGRLDRRMTTVLYCRSSNRSRRCAQLLLADGPGDLFVLEGGYSGWAASAK